MISFDVLKRHGSTNERLREIFTTKATAQTPAEIGTEGQAQRERDYKFRQNVEEEIQSRLAEGVQRSAANVARFAAIDMAWDTSVLNRTTLPLLLYAQGKIDVKSCGQALAGLPNSAKYVKKDEQGNAKEIDLPLFLDTDVNLVRSMVTRRMAAQNNKYANLWPYYKYESRSTGLIGKLRADAMSQEADIMADGFGYREHDKDVYRDIFLYPHVVDFVRSSWEVERQLFEKVGNEAPEFTAEGNPSKAPEMEDRVVKEGVAWHTPHPSRVCADPAYPLHTINSDSGCEFLFYYDICRYRDIGKNPLYWNREDITKGSGLWQIYNNFSAYFQTYFVDVTNPVISVAATGTMTTLADGNDRLNNVGVYGASDGDQAVFKTEYFAKKRPVDIGCGTYAYPVWFRFVVAGDKTVIFAEILPSTPAAYCGINESSHRLNNIGFAEDILSYQDQLTNLKKKLLLTIEQELVKIFAINIDGIDPENLKALRNKINGQEWHGKPVVIEYSLKQLKDMGIDVDKIIQVSETRLGHSVEVIIRGMAEIIRQAEELQAMSPAEKGQPAPREISATETNEIAATTSTVYTFISDAIDSFHAAKKRIVYESTVACKRGEVRLPVVNRYSKETIAKAGFEIVADTDEEESGKPQQRRTIVGTRRMLQHDYIFTTRDGAERPVNVQAANTLTQLFGLVTSQPVFMSAMGKEKIYEMLNEIFRLIGAGFDLKLELQEGEDNSLGADPVQVLGQQQEQLSQGVQQLAQELQKQLQRMSAELQKQAQTNEQQDAINAQQDEAIRLLKELGAQALKMAQNAQKLEERQNQQQSQLDSREDDIKPSVSVSYKDLPPEVQSQVEYDAGYNPASEASRLAHQARMKKPAPKPAKAA